MTRSSKYSSDSTIGSWLAIGFAAVLIAAGFVVLGVLRQPIVHVSGDEGTFLAMTASLALDGDLVFAEPDQARAEAAGIEGGRQAIILQRTDKGLSYSKPVLYPVLAAGLYPLVGDLALVVVNLAALAIAVFFLLRFLLLLGEPARAGWTLVTCVGASVVIAYSVYMMSDMIQTSLAIVGGVLGLAGLRAEAGERAGFDRILTSGWAPFAGGLCLGLLGATRYPNLLIPAGIGFALAVAGRRKAATMVAVGAAVAVMGLSMANRHLGGAATPYKAERAQFNHATGYPAQAEEELAERQFRKYPARQSMSAMPRLRPALTAYSTFYFLVGRHTGVLLYFPAVIAIGWSLARSRDRVSVVLVLTALAGVAFYLVWNPRNYFGGGTFVGNRYFLPFFAVLILALPALLRRREMVATWIVALVAFSSALLSAFAARDYPGGSQSHVTRGIFPFLPYESVARAIEGPPDRYWSGDYLRVTTPFAKVWENQIHLEPGAPFTEIVVFTQHPDEDLSFGVSSYDRPVEVEVDNGPEVRRFFYEGRRARGVQELLVIEDLKSWRRHPFRWADRTPFEVRSFRIRALPHRESRVELRYLGTTLDGLFHYESLESDLPSRVAAGATGRIVVRFVNTSEYPWTKEGVVPVSLVHVVKPLAERDEVSAGEWTSIPLPHDLPPGEYARLEFGIQWPEEPGTYSLAIDLRYGSVLFADKVGSKLVESEVLVTGPVE